MTNTSNDYEYKEIITNEECPLCGDYLTIVEYKNEKTKQCGLSESCGYLLPLVGNFGFRISGED